MTHWLRTAKKDRRVDLASKRKNPSKPFCFVKYAVSSAPRRSWVRSVNRPPARPSHQTRSVNAMESTNHLAKRNPFPQISAISFRWVRSANHHYRASFRKMRRSLASSGHFGFESQTAGRQPVLSYRRSSAAILKGGTQFDTRPTDPLD